MARDILNASERTLVGSNAVKKLRNNNEIPGVLYGHHIESQSIAIDRLDFEKFYKHHGVGAAIDLNLDGNKVFVVVKNVQTSVVKQKPEHVDFQALSAGEKIKLKVPVYYTSKDKIPAGLILQEMHHELELNVLPKDLIEFIEVDLDGVELGDSMAISELDISKDEKYEILDPLDTVLYSIVEPKLHLEETEETEETETTETPETPE